MVDEAPVLELRGITKRFPGVVANDSVDFDLRRGEVHALLGENGAGKSTLMNVLYGLYHPDEGEILVKGDPIRLHSPKDAISHGIGMVHQHFMLIPVMTVAENIVLATEPTHAGVLLDYRAANKRVAELSRSFNFAIDPGARVESITVGQQQRVEILKALYRAADILILDDRGLGAVRGVSFEVRSGEIVGLAGVDGNGQSELIDAISGLRRVSSGSVAIGGRDVTGNSPSSILDLGLGHIPEDRQLRGLVLEFSLAENLALHDFDKPPDSRLGWLFPRQLIRRARDLLKQYDVRGGGPQTRAAALSGGNQQKVVLAREIGREPSVLIAAQPTRGLDVGAIEFVHRRLIEARDNGKAVLLVSLELDEILSLSDRVLVVYEGQIVAEHGPDVSEEQLGIEMTGGGREVAA